MNTYVQHQDRNDRATVDWQPRPALRDAMRRIATIADGDHSAEITDREIAFANYGERTTISVEPIDIDTWDGQRITECVTIRTPLTRFKLFDEQRYTFINIFATTGAVVRNEEEQDAIISRLPLFEGDDVALADLYTPVIANAACMQVVGPVCGFYYLQSERAQVQADKIALHDWDSPSRWGASEFQHAEDLLRQAGAYANGGEGGLTVEFPWEAGAISAIAGECTSLFQVRADQPHPSAGNGLFYRLDLPVNFSDDDARQWAVRLNRIEAESLDTPPFFGAWCTMPQSGTLSFAGFWPNLMYKPGTVSNIAFWNWARSRFARQVIGNLH